ncbi:MAG: DUF6079 family protein [Bacillota bacterium]
MKYGDLFTLNPIETVIKINDADNRTKAKRLISTFVITPSLGRALESVAIPQLDLGRGIEGKGIFVVGNYGTGKSHVMSFVSLIAEDASYLEYVRDESWREKMRLLAGHFKVRRLQIAGTMMSLYEMVADELCALARSVGFTFQFRTQSEVPNVKYEFMRFMESFDSYCPGMGVLLVIDELLGYLDTRDEQALVLDLSVLQALGEFCDGSRFRFVAGLQQSLFSNPRFNHVASAVNRVKQRFYDFVIDGKGIEELVERYLFQKTAEQRERIRDVLKPLFPLYEVLPSEIERFVSLFPAHPSFLQEFQRVFVVERREILTVLSREARSLVDREIDGGHLDLVTADKYWRHIEADQGLRANSEIAKVVQNVVTIRSHIAGRFLDPRDEGAALRLIYGLAVNRLTTDGINTPVGMTPGDLKNSLLWETSVPVQDPNFLTLAAKRLLDKAREAANGQFLSYSETSGQYFIDPTRDVDYDQHVATVARTLRKDTLLRYLNEVFARALEIDSVRPISEGRLWEYSLVWKEKGVDRPGWLFFGFPGQRSTAQPPKDFYLFIVPSRRVLGVQESWDDKPDEAYWFLEDFPPSRFEKVGSEAENDEGTFLDMVREYAAAKERAAECKGDEHLAYERIARNRLEVVIPLLNTNANTWLSVRFDGRRRSLGEWLADLAPSRANSVLKDKFDTLSQLMFASHFDRKYPGYPSFAIEVRENTREQIAQAALEILCETGMATTMGRAVLSALGLYEDTVAIPERSPWLTKVLVRLGGPELNHVLNNSDLFESRDGRVWMKGEPIEAEWLLVVLAAGVASGYLIITGVGNTRFDASNLREMYRQVSKWDRVVRVSRPSAVPVEKWAKLFSLLKVNRGLLANSATYGPAMVEFQSRLSVFLERLLDYEATVKGGLPFSESFSADTWVATCESAKSILETLVPLNHKSKMSNLRIETREIAELAELLRRVEQLEALLQFLSQYHSSLSALVRFEEILKDNPAFQDDLQVVKRRLREAYADPSNQDFAGLGLSVQKATQSALRTYHSLERSYSLSRDGDTRRKQLLQGQRLRQMSKLSRIAGLNKAALDKIESRIVSLPIYQGCSDEELLRSPTSLNPMTRFDPRNYEGQSPADAVLQQCEEALDSLFGEWTSRLLAELRDHRDSPLMQALTNEEKTVILQFLSSEEIPEPVDDSFVASVNALLRGLRLKTLSVRSLTAALFHGSGGPLKVMELRVLFEKWLDETIGDDDPESIRFLLETGDERSE